MNQQIVESSKNTGMEIQNPKTIKTVAPASGFIVLGRMIFGNIPLGCSSSSSCPSNTSRNFSPRVYAFPYTLRLPTSLATGHGRLSSARDRIHHGKLLEAIFEMA